MTQYAVWTGYAGDARIWLALGLLAAAAVVTLAAITLPGPVRLSPPRPAVRTALLLCWGTALVALLVCSSIYFTQVRHNIQAAGLRAPTLKLTILPVTLTAAAALFAFIASRGFPDRPARLASAAIGAIAAPMIFELPFDPIVIFRFHLPAPGPAPWALVYPSLVLVEISTLLLLWLSPMVRLTRATFAALALMLGVWAAWALAGFDYPSSPLPLSFNIASKLLAFVTAVTMFAPPRRRPAAPDAVAVPTGPDATRTQEAGAVPAGQEARAAGEALEAGEARAGQPAGEARSAGEALQAGEAQAAGEAPAAGS